MPLCSQHLVPTDHCALLHTEDRVQRHREVLPVRLTCHPGAIAEPVGYLQRPVTAHVWSGKTEEVVVFECGECAGHWASGITRKEWLTGRHFEE